MLQHGAAAVLAIDTGYGQIAHKLRVDSRVRLLERTNARKLELEQVTMARYFYGHGCLVHLGHAGAAGCDGCDAAEFESRRLCW